VPDEYKFEFRDPRSDSAEKAALRRRLLAENKVYWFAEMGDGNVLTMLQQAAKARKAALELEGSGLELREENLALKAQVLKLQGEGSPAGEGGLDVETAYGQGPERRSSPTGNKMPTKWRRRSTRRRERPS
jgi:hypothetical protein